MDSSLKIKIAITISNSFETLLLNSKKKPILIEPDDGSEFVEKIFPDLFRKNNFKRYSRYITLGVVFAVRFNRTIRDLFKKLFFEKTESNWVDVLPTKREQYNIGNHSSTKLTPIQASVKKKEGFVCHVFLDKRKKIKPKFKIHDLVRVADLKK